MNRVYAVEELLRQQPRENAQQPRLPQPFLTLTTVGCNVADGPYALIPQSRLASFQPVQQNLQGALLEDEVSEFTSLGADQIGDGPGRVNSHLDARANIVHCFDEHVDLKKELNERFYPRM